MGDAEGMARRDDRGGRRGIDLEEAWRRKVDKVHFGEAMRCLHCMHNECCIEEHGGGRH